MLEGVNHTRDQVELGFIKQFLQEIGLTAELHEPSPQLPLSALVVPLAKDDQGRDRYISFSYVPFAENEVQHVRLLQMYTIIPVTWNEGTKEQLLQLFPLINGSLAIGHFGLNGEQEVYYRYVYTAPGGGVLSKEEILGVIDLFVMGLDAFSPMLEGIASGTKEWEEVASMFQ